MPQNANPATESAELFGQMTRTMEAAMKSGIRIQEESARWMTEMLGEMTSPQKWQKRTQTVMEEAVTMVQKNMDQVISMLNQNAKAGLDLLQKALETGQSESSADAQAKTREWWEAALSVLRTNTEGAIQANSRMLESWRELAKRLNGNAMERMAEGAKQMAEQMA